MKIVRLTWWQRLFYKPEPIYWIPPTLSENTIELLLIALRQAETVDGNAIWIVPEYIFQPWVLEQIPVDFGGRKFSRRKK